VSFIQVGTDARIRRRCHLVVSFSLERVHEKCVELRGFEPLTSCMPCLPDPSGGVALGRVTAGRKESEVWVRRAASAVVLGRCHLICH
jgi:hypothetical protein